MPLLEDKNVSVSILRLDKIHPVVSGNKMFKLKYYLKEAIKQSKPIITFGGPYSNHLAATAFACYKARISCTGIVRGEHSQPSDTLKFCAKLGMKLQFISREEYRDRAGKDHSGTDSVNIIIPEGGYGKNGVRGSALIASLYDQENFTHVCCPVGTATTLAGIISSAPAHQQVIGFSALKNLIDIPERLQFLLDRKPENYLVKEYHFGGYAKWDKTLIDFMNKFYELNKIPTDFVYTGKMMYGIWDMIRTDQFLPGSKILVIHTGGLQGNHSLPAGSLNF